MIILLGYGILGCKPYILPGITGILKTGSCKGCDRLLGIMHTLYYSGTVEFMYGLSYLLAKQIGIYYLSLTGTGNLKLHIFIYITVGMAGQSDRLLPVTHTRLYTFNYDRRSEYSAVKHGSYGSVRTLPHLLKIVFFYSCGIGRDGGALNGHTVLKSSIGAVHSNLIVRIITILKSEIIVLRLKLHIRQNELSPYHLPQYPCHLIPIHLN